MHRDSLCTTKKSDHKALQFTRTSSVHGSPQKSYMEVNQKEMILLSLVIAFHYEWQSIVSCGLLESAVTCHKEVFVFALDNDSVNIIRTSSSDSKWYTLSGSIRLSHKYIPCIISIAYVRICLLHMYCEYMHYAGLTFVRSSLKRNVV